MSPANRVDTLCQTISQRDGLGEAIGCLRPGGSLSCGASDRDSRVRHCTGCAILGRETNTITGPKKYAFVLFLPERQLVQRLAVCKIRTGEDSRCRSRGRRICKQICPLCREVTA